MTLTTHKTITLDGRKFGGEARGEETADQFEYVERHLRTALASEISDDPEGVTRTKERSAAHLVTQILLSGRSCYILAGCLTEEGRTWNRADADANAARFSQITDAEEKITMRLCIVEYVYGFRFRDADSSGTSRKPSSRSATARPAKNAAAPASGTWVN